MVLVGDAVEAAKNADYPAAFLEAFTEQKLSKDEVQSVLSEFAMSVSLGEIGEEAYSIVVTDVNEVEKMERARRLRLKLVKERNRIDRVRKELKEPYKRKVDVIDGVGRILRKMMEDAESHLELQETFAERIAAAELAKLVAEREAALAPYVEDMSVYANSLGHLEQPAFDGLLANAKEAFELREADRLRVEREKEIAAEALRLENDRLRREAEEARIREQSEKLQKEEAERKQREAEAETLRIRQEAERKDIERLFAEEAERRRIADEAAKLAAAPDREKLLNYVERVRDTATSEFPVSLENSIARAHAEVFLWVVKAAADDLTISAQTLRAEAVESEEAKGCPF